MTDDDVVKVLAEFMGWEYDMISLCWRNPNGEYPNHQFSSPPDYMKDYNAIAEVWRRVDEGPYSDIYMRVRGVLDDDEHWRSWYQSKPRDHAHALAKAILEAKKQDEPGDWEGDGIMSRSNDTPNPCPWCGSAATVVVDIHSHPMTFFWVQCDDEDCMASGPSKRHEDNAIAAWNRMAANAARADDPPAQEAKAIREAKED